MSLNAELDVLLRSSSYVSTLGLASVVLIGASFFVLYLRQRSTQESAVEVGKALQQKGSSEPEEHTGPKVTLLYGTQTGTAERFAKQLKNEMVSRYGDDNNYAVVDIEDYKAEEVLCNEKLVFFLMATYGDGEPTDNAADFYNWLIKAGKEVEGGDGKALLKVRPLKATAQISCGHHRFHLPGLCIHALLVHLGTKHIVMKDNKAVFCL